MLYDLSWLETGQIFPPEDEATRMMKYEINRQIFDSEMPEVFNNYAQRIDRVIGNFDDVISFPIIFNYQRLMTMKMADLVCGEYPTINADTDENTEKLGDIIYDTDFNAKMFTTIIDMSRYGDGVWRIFSEDGKNTFTPWDPRMWFPITKQDGTMRVDKHVLCSMENRGTKLSPDWYLHVQIHEKGFYTKRTYHMDPLGGQIGFQLGVDVKVPTGLDCNAVMHIKPFARTDTVYGDDDYMQVDSIICELAERVAQISRILDKHADPALTGPQSMLDFDETTGKWRLKAGSYYVTAPGDNTPEYLTWDGQLEAAFKQVELLIDQLYVLSEMGAALTGAKDTSTQAVSAQAMRFKIISPLAKARRITNSITKSVQELLAAISTKGYTPIKARSISVSWADGIPDDPREEMELVKISTGENMVMPLDVAIKEKLKRTPAEAAAWIKKIDERAKQQAALKAPPGNLDSSDPGQQNPRPGPIKGRVASAKGSLKGVRSFKSPKNEK